MLVALLLGVADAVGQAPVGQAPVGQEPGPHLPSLFFGPIEIAGLGQDPALLDPYILASPASPPDADTELPSSSSSDGMECRSD